jgi:serine/threonine-protein kinase
MVMSDDDRTAMMGMGQQTRATEAPRGRHRPDSMVDDYDDYDDGEEERKRKRRKAWLTALITLLVVAVIVLGIWLVTKLLGNEGTGAEFVDLPNVQSQQEIAARTALQNAGFEVRVENVKCEPPGPGQDAPCTADQVNTVVRQDPGGGSKATKGSTVTMFVGRSATAVKIPDVKGKSKEEAKATLTGLGFVVSPEEVTEDATESKLIGKVVGTSPAIGVEIPKGSTVKLAIGKTPAQQDVPSVIGQDFNSAKTNLENDGFKVTRSDVDSDQPKDIVTDQTPKKARAGSVITLKVSKGPSDQVTMPNLTGLTEQAARNQLRGLGWDGELKVTEVDVENPQDFNEITGQDVQVGTKIARNQTINVNVAKKVGGSGGTP